MEFREITGTERDLFYMEPSKCMKEVLRAAHQFHINNAQLAYLLRQLEALQTASARSSYIRQLQTFDQVELVECLTFLVDVVREKQGQFELIQRVIGILLNLSHNEGVRKLLFETFSLCPPVVSVVVAYSGLPDEEQTQTVSEALLLLQRITYGHRIDFHQANVEDLLRFLIPHVLDGTTTLISPVLGTLANLCRNNVLVQGAIRNIWQPEFKKLLKTLCGYFDDQNQLLVIFSLSIFTSLCLNESEGQKVFFESSNVEQTLQTIFAIIRNNFKSVAWKYAADLLTDLLRHPQMQMCIRKYRHLPKCMNDVLILLASGSEESTAEMFELLLSLCSISSVRNSVNSKLFTPLAQNAISAQSMLQATRQPLTSDLEPLLCCLHWAAHEGRIQTACLAIEFLIDSCQDCLCGTERSYPVHLLTPVFTDLISRPEQTNSTEKTIKLVQLLSVLCSDKLSRELLGTHLTREVLESLVEKRLSQGYISYAAATSSLTEEEETKEGGSRCVLLLLDLALRLRKAIPGLSDYLANILKEPRLMDTLALGLTSVNHDLVETALRLLCFSLGVEDTRPDVVLCGSIACLNKQKQTAKRLRVDSESTLSPSRRLENAQQNKENRPQPLLSSTPVNHREHKNRSASDKSSRGDVSIENLIEKMEDIMGSKDTKTAEVIEVFEHHIKALQIKEEHLNNLLEAKSLALTQADRVIAQLRGRQASHSAEMKKLQSVLKESERKIEQMVSQMNEMRINSDKMQAQFESQLDKKQEEVEALCREKDEVIEKCTEFEERVANCRQENKTLSSMMDALQEAHETLKEQYNISCNQSKQLEEERKTLSKQLKEKDASVQKLSSTLQSLQSKYKETEEERAELEKEKDNMEAYVDKLRHQLSASENSCRELQQRVTILESVNQEQEEKLKQKTEKVAELEAELEKHNQIVSFINNMQLKGAGGKK